MVRSTATRTRQSAPETDETPFYGWRYVTRVGPGGKSFVEQKLLTLEDVLHPQEDDQIAQNSVHSAETRYVGDIAVDRESRLDRGLVLVDCIVDWGIEGLKNHCPDVSVFDRIIDRPPDPIGTFRLKPSGGRCVAALEIVSPHTRENDVDKKVRQYHQAQVPLYVIVDQKKEGGPRTLFAYRYAPARYLKVRPDGNGRIAIKELGISLALAENGLVCFDDATNERLGGYSAERAARQEAERRLRELEETLRQLRNNNGTP